MVCLLLFCYHKDYKNHLQGFWCIICQVFVQEHGHYFVAEDFSLLETVEYEKRVKQVETLVEKVEWEGIDSDELTRWSLVKHRTYIPSQKKWMVHTLLGAFSAQNTSHRGSPYQPTLSLYDNFFSRGQEKSKNHSFLVYEVSLNFKQFVEKARKCVMKIWICSDRSLLARLLCRKSFTHVCAASLRTSNLETTSGNYFLLLCTYWRVYIFVVRLCSEFLSTVIMGVSSAMAARTRSSDSVRFEMLKSEHRYVQCLATSR